MQASGLVVALLALSWLRRRGAAEPVAQQTTAQPAAASPRSLVVSEQIALARDQLTAQLRQGDSVANRGIAYVSLDVLLGGALVTARITDVDNRFNFGPYWWTPLVGLGLATLCFVVSVTADLVPRSFEPDVRRRRRAWLRLCDACRGLLRLTTLGRLGRDPDDVARGFNAGPEPQALHRALAALPDETAALTMLGALEEAQLANTRLLQKVEEFWAALGFLVLLATLLYGSVVLLVHW